MIFSLCLVVVIPCFACRALKNPHLFFLLWKCSTSKTRNFILSPFIMTSVVSGLCSILAVDLEEIELCPELHIPNAYSQPFDCKTLCLKVLTVVVVTKL